MTSLELRSINELLDLFKDSQEKVIKDNTAFVIEEAGVEGQLILRSTGMSPDEFLRYQFIRRSKLYKEEATEIDPFTGHPRPKATITKLILKNINKQQYETLQNKVYGNKIIEKIPHYKDGKYLLLENAYKAYEAYYDKTGTKLETKKQYDEAIERKETILVDSRKSQLDHAVEKIIKEYEKDGKDVFEDFEDIYAFIRNRTEKTTKFKPVLGAGLLQKISGLNTKKSKKEKHNGIVKKTFSTDDFALTIGESDKFDIFTQKIFDIYTLELTRQNHYGCASEDINSVVNPGIERIMKLLGTPNTKASKDKTRKKIIKSLNVIFNSHVRIQVKRNGKSSIYTYHVCSAKEEGGDKLTLIFSPLMSGYFIKSSMMQYPLDALKYKNPVAIKLAKRLSNHFGNNNNISKNTNSILGVSSLLDACSSEIPTYEEVKRTDRRVEKRIIEPLEKGLDYLCENGFLTRWEYCNAKKQPLTTEQLSKQLTYKDFEERYIFFEVKDFPDQSKRLENKSQKPINKKSKNEPKKRKSGLVRQQKRTR